MDAAPQPSPPGPLRWWTGTPLYVRILGGMLVGMLLGGLLHERAAPLGLVAGLVLRVLGALAPPLILVAVLDTLLTAQMAGGVVPRMARLLVLNTVVAIGIGLLVANVVRPGSWAHLSPQPEPAAAGPAVTGPAVTGPAATGPSGQRDAISLLLDNVPDSLLRPLVENNVIGIILIAVGFGLAVRRLGPGDQALAARAVGVAFRAVVIVLLWVIELVPLAVLGVVAQEVGTHGFGAFKALTAFVVAVVIALCLQLAYYLVRIAAASWVRPVPLMRGMRDAVVMAFSTDSSTATMPVTYRCLTAVGVRESSARLGALVGTNFNNDGTALYEAMAALFVAQVTGQHLKIGQQLLVVLTSIVASVGAAGIPEAGLVTMALVFTAVGLPRQYIGLLVTVDWFLDRCRTVVNMMGDVNVSCLLDGKTREPA